MTYQTVVMWRGNRPFTPPTDIIELPDRLIVMVEIAGMRTNAFSITILNRRLTISGKRERPAIFIEAEAMRETMSAPAYHQAEIGYGDFQVDVALPWGIIREEVSAAYRDGMLRVELPRKPDGRVHIVDVQPMQTINEPQLTDESPPDETPDADRTQKRT